MGLPLTMDSMHAPTIPSGPTSRGSTNGIKTSGKTLQDLQAQKDSLEAELKALSGVLDSHGVDMNTRLLTPDGFPRADLDVAQIRTTRSRIIYLKNDYKTLMNVIEKTIHEHFANLAQQPPEAANGSSSQSPESRPLAARPAPALDAAFARVNSVVPGSPAESAGLKAGDEIRNIGYVNWSNNESLRRVADCVQGNEGHDVIVKLSRKISLEDQRQELQLTLTPRRDWGGRGLLGCHILPI